MRYAEKQLVPGEEILYRARYHWIFYRRAILPFVLSIAAAAAEILVARRGGSSTALALLGWAAGGLLAISILIFLVLSLRARADEFVVTDRRIIHKIGIFAHETRQAPLSKVQDITVDQSVWGRMLGYGDLGIETASEAGQIVFPSIADPEKLRTAIWTHVGTGGVSSPVSEPAARPSASSAGSAAERLEHLNQLEEKGLITPEEFAAKRSRLLEEL
jgi:membrane protein YdbS with pleckstrin-like domain